MAKRRADLRFPGVDNDWELRKLSELADIIGGGTLSTSNCLFWENPQGERLRISFFMSLCRRITGVPKREPTRQIPENMVQSRR